MSNPDDEDVHRSTAAEIFDTPETIDPFDEVQMAEWQLRDAIMRRAAGIKPVPPEMEETQFVMTTYWTPSRKTDARAAIIATLLDAGVLTYRTDVSELANQIMTRITS